MKRVFALLAGVAFVSLLASPLNGADTERPAKVRILLTTGGHAFEVEPFYAMFDAMKGIEYTKAEMPKEAGVLKPGLEKECDCIVMYDMCKPGITPEQQEAFVKLVKDSGIGVVSMHHNLGAHWDWDEFRKIIGGRFILKDTELDGKAYGNPSYRRVLEQGIRWAAEK
ncbi:MAG: hypothetical protein GXX96_08165 [Planctomycetaceae bacterium]|nr:hypothetical protein [Planctomycetaceae bacterium]